MIKNMKKSSKKYKGHSIKVVRKCRLFKYDKHPFKAKAKVFSDQQNLREKTVGGRALRER